VTEATDVPVPAVDWDAAGAIQAATARARAYADQAKAPNTLRGYRADWRHFTAWCEDTGQVSMPASPETVAVYLSDLAGAGYKANTIRRRISAISQAHQIASEATPTSHASVRAVWSGIRRVHGSASSQKAPTLTDDVREMVAALPVDLSGLRDRALLLVGFAGAFRRSELVGLDATDIEAVREGMIVTIRRSKTDQEGQGRKIGIPRGQHPATCPVRAVQAWVKAAGIEVGPLFRGVDRHGNLGAGRLSDRAVALVVKRSADMIGLDPAHYAGHSLRAGLATSAAAAGVSERAIMNQTGHRSVDILRRYIREGSLFRENAAGGVGL